jgi:hypothetical protein
MKRFGLAMTALALLLPGFGCGEEVDGPTPVINKVESSLTNTNAICTCKDLANQGCEVPQDVELSIIGSGFAPLLVGLQDEPNRRLELPNVIQRFQENGKEIFFDGVDPSNVPAGTRLEFKDSQTLVLHLSTDYINTMAHGPYDLTVANPNGNEGELKDALEVILGPVLLSVDPSVVHNDVETEVTIKGKHFGDGAGVLADNTELTNVKFVDDETIRATVPKGLVEGLKNLRVTNPELCFAVRAILQVAAR